MYGCCLEIWDKILEKMAARVEDDSLKEVEIGLGVVAQRPALFLL